MNSGNHVLKEKCKKIATAFATIVQKVCPMRAAHKKTASLPCVTIQKQFPSIFSESTKASALYIIRFCNVCDDVRILMTSVYVGFVFRKLRMHRLRVWIGMETVADPISAYWMWVGERAGYSIATTIFCNVYPPSTLAKQRAAKTILPKLLFCRFVFFLNMRQLFFTFFSSSFLQKTSRFWQWVVVLLVWVLFLLV